MKKSTYDVKDSSGELFTVAYKEYDDESLFSIDTKDECATLHLEPKQLRILIRKMTKLCDNLEYKKD